MISESLVTKKKKKKDVVYEILVIVQYPFNNTPCHARKPAPVVV